MAHVNIQIHIQEVQDEERDRYDKVVKRESMREQTLKIVADTKDSAVKKAVNLLGIL